MTKVLAGVCAALLVIACTLGWFAYERNEEVSRLNGRISTMSATYKQIQKDNKAVELKVGQLVEEVEDATKTVVPTVRAYAAGLRLRQQPRGDSCTTPESAEPTGEPEQGSSNDLPTASELQADCAEATVMVLGWQKFYGDLLLQWNTPAGIIPADVPAAEEKAGIYAGTE